MPTRPNAGIMPTWGDVTDWVMYTRPMRPLKNSQLGGPGHIEGMIMMIRCS